MNHTSPQFTRKEFVQMLSGMPLAFTKPFQDGKRQNENAFPLKDLFEIKGTFINAAYTHPMSKGSAAEMMRFIDQRKVNGKAPSNFDGFDRTQAQANFVKLINAEPEEIAWIPSTMFGENFIVNGLSIPHSKSKVVTDALHFHGSLHLYNQLEKDGVGVTVVRPRNNSIDLNDMDKAITPGTRLVAVSLVSANNGFVHDLKKLCDLAHSRGALVYADIIQAAGAIPIDVKATGVDFCATATYKWLMGDFGIGFLYVNKKVLPQLKRTMVGYRQMASSSSHIFPFDAKADRPFESTSKEDMSGHFELGTFANAPICALRYSLELLLRIGVDKIQEYRQPMIDRLQNKLANSKWIPLTPPETKGPIVCFALKDTATIIKPKLDATNINISVYENMIRIAPSFYNDLNEIDTLIKVLLSV